jgi:hypothetical protein
VYDGLVELFDVLVSKTCTDVQATYLYGENVERSSAGGAEDVRHGDVESR